MVGKVSILFTLLLKLMSLHECASRDQRACLRSLEDVREAYLSCRHFPGSPSYGNSMFTFYPERAKTFTIAALLFAVGSTDNSTHASQGCCNPGDSAGCKVILRFRTVLFRELYPPILVMSAFPFSPNIIIEALNNFRDIEENRYLQFMQRYGMKKYCWNTPAFCQEGELFDSPWKILREFSKELPHLVLNGKEGPIEVGDIDGYHPDRDAWESTRENMKTFSFGDKRAALGVIIILSFILTIPLVLLFISWYNDVVRVVLVKSTLAAECMYTGMIHSWFWTVYLNMHSICLLRSMFIYTGTVEKTDKIQYNFIMQEVVTQLILFLILSVITLIELPLLVVYFWRSPMVKGVYKEGRRSNGLVKLRKLVESFGWFGIILFCQNLAILMVYDAIFFFINPLYTTMQVAITFLVVALSAVLTLVFGVSTLKCCKTCSVTKCIKMFIISFSILIVGCACYLMKDIIHEMFFHEESVTMLGLMSSVISSGALALCGYVCKKAIWNKIIEEVREFDIQYIETHPSTTRDPPTPLNPFETTETNN